MEVETIEFAPLWDSTLMCLRDLPVFDTTGEASHCTKFLINRVHTGALWLDKAYPIHVEDIHKLTGMSMEGRMLQMDFRARGNMTGRRES
jgi:hypothetical protein